MPNRLPSLNALRAFESAARHMSFARAAEELHVTPGAISQQVRQLEDSLGQRLFLRQNNSLSITFAGKALLPQVREAFNSLIEATDLVRSKNFENILKISAPPTFSIKWLRPRLTHFQNLHPDLEIRLTASKQLADFNKEDLDVAIRYGQGSYEGLTSEKIMAENIFPVCSPALIKRTLALRKTADLKHHTLLHAEHSASDETAPSWSKWLRLVCPETLEIINASKGMFYTPALLAIDAAIAGEGIALAKGKWVQDDLSAGRLVQPFEDFLHSEFDYYLVYPQGTASAKVTLFRQWLFETQGLPVLSEISSTANSIANS
jgi:LysR family glycine cleavage system transcriptional activator